MMLKAGWPIELKVAPGAWNGWSFKGVVVGTWMITGTLAGTACSALAWMVGCIVVIEATIAEVAPVAAVREAFEGFTPFIMVFAFQQAYDVGCFGPAKNDEGLPPTHHL